MDERNSAITSGVLYPARWHETSLEVVYLIENILAKLIDKVENRYYGKYRGLVEDNNDEEGLGRIKAKVPQLLGDIVTGWCLACLPYGGAQDQGFFALPEKGAGVWIEFEGGDISHPIWSGTWWSSGEVPEPAQDKKKMASKKVFKTKNKHTIMIDDNEDVIEIKYKDNSTVKIDSDGILIKKGSKSIKLTDSSVSINGGHLVVE